MNIEFEWELDAKGYELTDDELQVPLLPPTLFGPSGILVPENRFPDLPADSNAAATYFPSVRFPDGLPVPPPDLAPEDQRLRVVRNGGRLVGYRVAQDNLGRVFEDFVNVRDATGVRDFYNRWGPLGRSGNIEGYGEPIWYLAKVISRMNQFVNAWAHPDKAKRERFIERTLGPDGFGICDIEHFLVFDPQTRKPRRQLRIPNLFAALWMGMTDVLTNEDKVLRRCAHCNELFTAGGDGDRRLDSRFCSDQHRILYHRMKNAPQPESESEPGQLRRRARPRRVAAA